MHNEKERKLFIDLFEKHLNDTLEWLAALAPGEGGGVTRLLYTDSWLRTQRELKARMERAGLSAHFDEAGNLYGRLEGKASSLSSILTGSHIDTVVDGGKYDGAYGVAAGLVALEYLLKRYGRPKRTLELVSLCEEEGSRFPLAYWGSGSIAGLRSFAQIADMQDSDGIGFEEAMRGCGFGQESGHKECRRSDIGAYIELHIEQGAVLESEGLAIGVVEAIAGQRRLNVTVTGEANHAGTTPMLMRRDALEGASAMMLELRQEAMRRGAPLVATVGKLKVQPNVPNVVPGRASFTVDIRHSDEAALAGFADWLRGAFGQLAKERGLDVESEEWFREKPVPMHDGLKRSMDAICGDFGLASKRMVSGAGHDGQMFGHICPTAMLFVPSRGGISHSPQEYTPPRELAAGALVLTELLYKLGYEGEEI